MRLQTLPFLLALVPALHAVDKVPAYKITDTYVTSPTMLVRAGDDSSIKEIWSGMDAKRMRHVPLFLETSIFAEFRRGPDWQDMRQLHFSQADTRPGYIRMVSDDGFVTVEMTSRRDRGNAPIFVRYIFKNPADLRITARFKEPQFTEAYHADSRNGNVEFTTLWRGENSVLTTTKGPKLNLATEPAGKITYIAKDGFSKEIYSAEEVVLCIDATEGKLAHPIPGSFVQDWRYSLRGYSEDPAAVSARRVSIESDNAKLDRLFEDSLDAVESHQFASGDVMADLFFYRDSWLRDGTYTIMGLSLAGEFEAADRYFAFWNAQRDFSVGGEREAQQPAIGITGMWFYSRLDPKAAQFLGSVWPYVRFYADYYANRVKKEGMLHLAEEWICFIPAPSTWPNAEVYSGLRAAAKIAASLGHGGDARNWGTAADRLQERFLQIGYDADKGRLIPMAGAAGETFSDPDYPKAESRNGPLRDDRVDSGMLIIPRLEVFGRNQGIIAVDDPRFESTHAQITRDLENPDHSIFRFGPNPGSPHAPKGESDEWPINTAWAAQDEWLMGRTDLAWRYVLSGIVNKADVDMDARHGYLPEFWDPKGVPDKPLIVWSHGDFVTSVMLLFLGFDLEPTGADLGLAPSLPPGMNHARVSRFRFRDWHLTIDLAGRENLIDVTVASSDADHGQAALVLGLPQGLPVRLKPGSKQHFTVDPALYYRAFGRSRNAAARVGVISRILGGGDPARDPSHMTPAEQEEFIMRLETAYKPHPQ